MNVQVDNLDAVTPALSPTREGAKLGRLDA